MILFGVRDQGQGKFTGSDTSNVRDEFDTPDDARTTTTVTLFYGRHGSLREDSGN